jgi:phage shock protein PspC (stress-responsive transcriptional regulator)
MRARLLTSLAGLGWGMMTVMNDANGGKRLVRTRDGRVVAGVCSGLGEYLGLDANLIRLILAVVTVFSAGVGALAYLAAWVVIPEEGEKTSIAENVVNKNRK